MTFVINYAVNTYAITASLLTETNAPATDTSFLITRDLSDTDPDNEKVHYP